MWTDIWSHWFLMEQCPRKGMGKQLLSLMANPDSSSSVSEPRKSSAAGVDNVFLAILWLCTSPPPLPTFYKREWKRQVTLSQLLLQLEISMERSSSLQGSLLRSFGKNFSSDGRKKEKKTKKLLHTNVNNQQNEKSAYGMEENIFKLLLKRSFNIQII